MSSDDKANGLMGITRDTWIWSDPPMNDFRREKDQTIFFPFNPADDVIMAHSWVQLDGARYCFGALRSCPFCGSPSTASASK